LLETLQGMFNIDVMRCMIAPYIGAWNKQATDKRVGSCGQLGEMRLSMQGPANAK